MSGPDRGQNPWHLRASDADREAYVGVLQEAFAQGRISGEEYEERMDTAYRARSYADLAPLVRDLPVDPLTLPVPPGLPTSNTPVPLASTPVPATGTPPAASEAPVIAVFSDVKRADNWLVPDGQVAVAVFGSATLDLRRCVLSRPQMEIRAFAVLGSVEILVPEEIDVRVEGTAILGDFNRKDKRPKARRGTAAPAGSPTLRVTGVAFLGSVDVKVVGTVGADAVRIMTVPTALPAPPEALALPPSPQGVAPSHQTPAPESDASPRSDGGSPPTPGPGAADRHPPASESAPDLAPASPSQQTDAQGTGHPLQPEPGGPEAEPGQPGH